MLEDLNVQMKAFVTIVGAFFVAIVGVFARHVYHEQGFSFKRALWDIPFAILMAVCAGAVGTQLGLFPMVTYAIAGCLAYLGPQWFNVYLRKQVEKRTNGDADDAARIE